MDLDAIEKRRPQVVIVDELAHSNVPGSRHEKRWQDVAELVKNGISVITAVNVQHLESLHGQVLKITGPDVTERIPDQLLREADEVANVDLTVGELRARLAEGKIYDPAKVPTALANFFQAENLLQLRRLAVREVAQLLDWQVETEAGGAAAIATPRRNDDRLLACINSNAEAAREIIRKASRLADRFSAAAWYVLYVQTGRESADRIGLATQRHQQPAVELGGQILRAKDDDVVAAIRRVAREKGATLLVCGITREKSPWERLSRRGLTHDLLRADVKKTTWVLINLLANAIRYSPAGKTIAVRAARAGKFVQVTVQDAGPGIAAEHHDKIFQRFAQLPDKAGYTGGSGLGLSIAREFIPPRAAGGGWKASWAPAARFTSRCRWGVTIRFVTSA